MNINQALAITGAAFPKVPVTVSSDRVCASNPVLRLETSTSANVTSSVIVPQKAIATLLAMPESTIAFNGEKLTICSSLGRASFQYASACGSEVFTGERPVALVLGKGSARKLGEVAAYCVPEDLNRPLLRGVTIIADGTEVIAMAWDGNQARSVVIGLTSYRGCVTLTQECAKSVAKHFDAPMLSFGERAFCAVEGDLTLTGSVLQPPHGAAMAFASNVALAKIHQPSASLSAEQVSMLSQAVDALAISAFDMTVHGDASGITLVTRTHVGAARVFVPCMSEDFTVGTNIKYFAEAIKNICGGGQLSVCRDGKQQIVFSPELNSFNMTLFAPLNYLPVDFVPQEQGEMYV